MGTQFSVHMRMVDACLDKFASRGLNTVGNIEQVGGPVRARGQARMLIGLTGRTWHVVWTHLEPGCRARGSRRR